MTRPFGDGAASASGTGAGMLYVQAMPKPSFRRRSSVPDCLAVSLTLCLASSGRAQTGTIPARDSLVPLAPITVTTHARSTGDSLSTWPASARRARRDSINAGRARWTSHRPGRYVIATYMKCGFCGSVGPRGLPPGTYPAMRVLGSEAVGVDSFHPADSITGYPEWHLVTVEGLFDMVESEVTDSTRRLDDLKLDPVYGFPRAWTTDRADNGYNGRFSTDGGYWGTTVYFAPAPPPAPCGGLRRLFARCPPDPFTPLTSRTVSTMARPTWDRILPQVPRDSSAVDRAVRVRYIVDSSGYVVSGSAVIVSAAAPEVAQMVLGVAEWWTFTPATLHRRPVAVRAEEELVFRATTRRCAAGEDRMQVVARDTLRSGVPRTFLDVARC